jgi:hypothetical protein
MWVLLLLPQKERYEKQTCSENPAVAVFFMRAASVICTFSVYPFFGKSQEKNRKWREKKTGSACSFSG